MSNWPSYPQIQIAFVNDCGPVLSALPNGVKGLATLSGIAASKINEFLTGNKPLYAAEFTCLTMIIDARYEYLEWEHDAMHSYRFLSDFTLFPTTRKMLIDVYDCVTGGGDITGAYEMVYPFKRAEYRYIVIDRYGIELHLICVPDNIKLDTLIEKEKLINISGARQICESLFDATESHQCKLLDEPNNRAALDAKFFSASSLALQQLSHSLLET